MIVRYLLIGDLAKFSAMRLFHAEESWHEQLDWSRLTERKKAGSLWDNVEEM